MQHDPRHVAADGGKSVRYEDAHGGEEGGPKVRDPHRAPRGPSLPLPHTALTPSTSPLLQYDMKIGMYVMKGHDQYRRKVTTDSEEIEGGDITDATPFMDYREVQVRYDAPRRRPASPPPPP